MLSIIDAYTDEPAGLGVPPYLNTNPRYVAGACEACQEPWEYLTIDDLRAGSQPKGDKLVVIAGIHTPGKYLTKRPGTIGELETLLLRYDGTKFLGGPAGCLGSGEYGGHVAEKPTRFYDYIIDSDIELAIFNYLKSGKPSGKLRTYKELKSFALKGTKLAKKHPDFPSSLICEIETYRGCSRRSYCSFCTEPLRYGKADFRPTEDIIAEVESLYNHGVRHFRLGKQPCFYSYQLKNGKLNPAAIEKLLSRIRQVAPNLKTLHIDNADPGAIASQPDASRAITESIVKHCTPGNIAAFGMESADPRVIEENNLNSDPDQVFEAIKLLNEVGSKRGKNGMPCLLPGLNFVLGLKGETKKTFNLNLDFLRKVLDANLMVRRINLRQVVVFPGTQISDFGNKLIHKHKLQFKHFKYRVRHDIDREMLKRVVPVGTILKDLRTEKHDGGVTFARQIGSYPLLVGIPEKLELDQWLDAKVVSYGYRSITAVPWPLDINTCSKKCLEAVPGIGRKTLQNILINRPLTKEQIEEVTPDF